MKEHWKDAWWTRGIYKVSDYGRVYNTKTKNYVQGSLDINGYRIITFSYCGKTQTWRLNRLVATVWERPLLKTEDAHHKNGFKQCNCRWNIQIKDNSKHHVEHRLGKKWDQQTKRKIGATNSWRKDPVSGKFRKIEKD